MIRRHHRLLAWLLFSVFVAGSISSFGLGVLNASALLLGDNLLFVAFAGVAGVGLLLALRRPENALGWVFSGMAAWIGLVAFAAEYTKYALVTSPGSLLGGVYVAWFYQWAWFPFLVSVLTVPFLLFPSGELPSRRWRPVIWAVVALASMGWIPLALAPELVEFRVRNPFGIAGLKSALEVMFGVIFAMVPILAIASAGSLVLRFRRAQGVERQQIKWFMSAGALIAVYVSTATVLDAAFGVLLPGVIMWTLLAMVPVSAGIAILKYRLYDIDVFINKTLVYGVLAMFITAVYVGVVVGIGSLVGRGDEPNLALSILATAVVAVAFQPVRERVQRLANRLVYGKRATPYEVLANFGQRMSSTYGTEDLLPRMADILREGTAAQRAAVWLNVGGQLQEAAVSPPSDARSGAVSLDGERLRGADTDLEIPVRHQDDLLGAISIKKRPGEPVTPTEEKLVRDVAAQVGLVLRNVKLIEELRASRQRLVAAQDEERRKIERNIHDGAQQQLVALNVKLGLTKSLVAKDVEKADQLLLQLQQETTDALENLRDLARGIYPPLLADKGLPAALQAQARKGSFPVEVDADGVGRLPQEAEAAVYFCALEALQNVAKYANASRAVVRMTHQDGDLVFEIEDDGRGFDPNTVEAGAGLTNMTDRIEALGGNITVQSKPGSGTTVIGRIPIRAEAAA